MAQFLFYWHVSNTDKPQLFLSSLYCKAVCIALTMKVVYMISMRASK